ncbi:MAG: hypothetical protein R2795_20290 [Saprospiraceae bacterium]
MQQYLAEHSDEDVAVIGIGFERYREADKAISGLISFKNQYGLTLLVLWGDITIKRRHRLHCRN